MKLTTRQVFAIVLFLGIFLLTFRPVTDPDFWWHLRTGQWILEHVKFPSRTLSRTPGTAAPGLPMNGFQRS